MRRRQGRNDIDKAVEVQVGGMSNAIVHTEAVIHDSGENACVAGGLYVNFRVADEDGLVRFGC